ncbi:hypothetical protein F5Y06DRAFT_291699 [Hypoxylon sp. FL0890]|nr:hypothetical protein F5Y06DRAFT_291699 [Hypoxylon sp. FL0890]
MGTISVTTELPREKRSHILRTLTCRLLFVVLRVKAGITSKTPSAHLDFPPTFLDIAGIQKADFPPFQDGRSLLSKWHNPQSKLPTCPLDDTTEVINVEFWGGAGIELPLQDKPGTSSNNSYKTLVICLDQAMGPKYNSLFNDTSIFPQIAFQECL